MPIPIFMHIEHTGGTSMREILDRQYAEDKTFFFYMTHHEEPTTTFINLPDETRDNLACLRGHMYYGVHRHLNSPSTYYTLMRHPFKRVVSSYYYYMRKPRLKDHHRYISGEMTWEMHLEEPWYTQTQLARICGGDDDFIQQYWARELPDNAVEIAKQNIENDFSFVGTVGYYDESLLMMQDLLNWDVSIYYARRNVAGSEKRTFKDLPKRIQKLIEKKTEPELELFEYVKKRLENQIESRGDDFQEALKTFQVKNETYGKRRLAWEKQVNRVKNVARKLRDTIKPEG